jgi:hypothetical protein
MISHVVRESCPSPRGDEWSPLREVRMHPDPLHHMSFDSSGGESAIATTNRRLRARLEVTVRVVRAQLADAAPDQQRELRASLREICADARRAGLRAEQLLVLIKDVWSSSPSAIARVQTMHGDERLNYVISTCVDEYYGVEPRDTQAQREVLP